MALFSVPFFRVQRKEKEVQHHDQDQAHHSRTHHQGPVSSVLHLPVPGAVPERAFQPRKGAVHPVPQPHQPQPEKQVGQPGRGDLHHLHPGGDREAAGHFGLQRHQGGPGADPSASWRRRSTRAMPAGSTCSPRRSSCRPPASPLLLRPGAARNTSRNSWNPPAGPP